MSVCNALVVVGELFDLDRLDDADPFEIDRQAAHLFEHAHWLMVADIAGEVLMVPLAPSDHDDPTRCRPICYLAAKHLADRYKEDR